MNYTWYLGVHNHKYKQLHMLLLTIPNQGAKASTASAAAAFLPMAFG